MEAEVSLAEDAPISDPSMVATFSPPEEPEPGADGRSKSLKSRAIHGSVWTLAGYGGSQMIRFGANIVLTHYLFPRAFGLMALINVLIQGLQMFSDLGIGPAIIKHTHTHDPDFFNTAWTMQVVRGFVLWIAACVLAIPAASFYGTPMLASMLPVAALTALISGFNSTKLFIEGRELRLARVVVIEVGCQIVSVAVMIVLARIWGSVWALVLGGLLGTLLKVVFSHVALPGMSNRFCWHRESAHHLYHFGRWIFLSTLFTFLAMQSDRLLLGRLTTIEELGIYSIALGLVSIVLGVFEQFANRILMPAMSHFRRHATHQFAEVVSRSRKYVLSTAVVAIANMILLAPGLFYLLYDSRYHEAGLISRWLGFGLWFTLLQRTSQASLLALGHSKVLALANSVNCLITMVAAPIGFHFWGMEGFIAGWTLGNLAAAIIVDAALTREGIPLFRQDAVLTAGLILFVGIGLSVRYLFGVDSVFTANAWQIKLISSALLSAVAAGILYLEYRCSHAVFSASPDIAMNGMAHKHPVDGARILSNGAASGVNGKPMNDVICRDEQNKMEIFATIVMLAWVPAVLILFAVLPPPRAVIVVFLSAWLFLPVVSYKLPVLPDYTKMSATCAGVFLGALLFDAKRLLRFIPSWFDLPVLVLCVCPFFSSMSNGLGEWDGLSSIMVYMVSWGMPYFIGRIYFNDVKTIRELAIGIVIGGLLYVPLCLFEIRMSPKLHEMVYGFAARGVQMRFGGWRPNVFMDGGLQVGLWMTGASLVGLWLAWTGVWKKLWGMSANTLVLVLVATTILCRSSESLVLLFAGLGALGFFFYTKSRIAFVCLLLAPPFYIVARATEVWHAEQVIDLARMVNAERADSLKFRIDNEDILIARAVQRPIFGWGGWGRSRVHDEFGKDISITDGHWIIELGAHGIIGVTSCYAAFLLPLGLLTTRYPVRRLLSREMAPVLVLSMIVSLYAIDCLPNALPNPVYMLVDGAVVGFVRARRNLSKPAEQNEIQGNIDEPAESIPLRRLHPGSV